MLPSEQLRIQYKCDGQTTQFTVPYYFLQDQDLRVAVTDLKTSTTILLKLNSDYTVTGAKSISGGMITTKVKYANNLSLDISRINISLTQLLNLTRNGSLPAESVETSLDKITMLLQQINAAMANTIRVPIDDPLNHNLMLPLAKQRARKFLMFDEQGNISVDYDALAIAEETRQASSSAKSSATASASSAAVSLQHANDSHNYMDESRRFMEQAEAIDLGFFKQDGVGAISRLFVDKVREQVSILDFGAIGDGVTDCYNAFMSAIAANTYGAGYYVSAGTILIPPGIYYISQTINLKKQVKFVGCGSAKGYSYAPIIKFAAGVHGFIVHRYNTNEAGTETVPTTAADGSVFDGLHITAVNATVGYFHGIWMRAAAVIRDTQVAGFSGHGIYSNASAGAGGVLEGNANNWYLHNVRSASNGGCGIYIRGADANAGNGIALDVANNTEYGIADYSFLGNLYSGCHSAVNGTSTVTRAWVNYGGRVYVCINAALGGTTTPGTSASVWYDYVATAGADNWVYGNTYVQGGAYAGIGASARNMFTNCYSENGQPPSYFSGASQMVFGGLHAANTINGVTISNNGTFSNLGSIQSAAGATIGLGGNSTSNAVLTLTDSSSSRNYPYRLQYKIGEWYLNWGDSSAHWLTLYNRDTTTSNGYARDFSTASGGIGFPYGYFWGAAINYVSPPTSAAPTTGTYKRGDIFYNSNPTSGGYIGWVCTIAGTPGTWKTFGVISS